MATKIRLRRMGRSKRPVFSIVVIDSRKSRDSSFIEDLGRYYPLRDPAEVVLKEDRALHWLRTGAQASDTVRGIFSERGLMLRLHLERKGTSDEEIERIVSEWEEERASKEEKFDVTSTSELAAEQEAAVEEPEADGQATETEAEAEPEAEEAAEAESDDVETAEPEEADEAEEEEDEDDDEAEEAEDADVKAAQEAQAEASKKEAQAASEEEVEKAKEEQDKEG